MTFTPEGASLAGGSAAVELMPMIQAHLARYTDPADRRQWWIAFLSCQHWQMMQELGGEAACTIADGICEATYVLAQ